MTCRHEAGDPNCSSSREGQARQAADSARRKKEDLLSRTPDPEVFEVIRVEKICDLLVMEVQYTSCTKCSFDAKKIMVFDNVKLEDVIPWRNIDPHFREAKGSRTDRKVAPPPIARFPADDTGEGWQDAREYAHRKYEKKEKRG